jgi:UDP-N-acetylmuramoyl-tripeptide--D-alanyl-D-alanine ligase
MKSLYERFDEEKGICTDTRILRSGQIFFALKGEKFNGNDYAAEAINKGASAVVIDELDKKIDPDQSEVFLVPDALSHLQNFASYHRKKWGKTIIAITGSNGKTTMKELLFNVFRKSFSTYATSGNLNNHIGVPLTLLNIKNHHDIAIVEMGANHIGEIKTLCEICLPNFGYITNFGLAHLEGFGGIKGVIKGKSELYEHLEKNQGTAFINPSDPIAIEKCNSKSIKLDSDVKFSSIKGFVKTSFGKETITTNLSGSYHELNILATITMARQFDIDDKKIASGLLSYKPQNNRGQIIKSNRNSIFLDAYNANPSSMEASLRNSIKLNEEMPHFYIAGGLLELGCFSKEYHQKIVDLFTELNILNAWFIGNEFLEIRMPKSYRIFKNTNEALDSLKKIKIQGQFIWIKGSRGYALENLLEAL